MAHLLERRDAVAYGLSVMVTDMLFHELPAMLTELLGSRQALAIIERLAKRTAEEGFRKFLESLGVDTGSLTLDEILGVFRKPPEGQPLHPFQRVTRVERSGEKVRLKVENGDTNLAILAGVIAGVLEAGLGVKVATLTARSSAQHLCHKSNVPHYIVYPEPPDTLVIERLRCGKS